jgi:hypothetical protein
MLTVLSLLMLWRRPAGVEAAVPCPPPPAPPLPMMLLLLLLLLLPCLGGTLSGTPPIVWRRRPERGGGPRFAVEDIVDCRQEPMLTRSARNSQPDDTEVDRHHPWWVGRLSSRCRLSVSICLGIFFECF